MSSVVCCGAPQGPQRPRQVVESKDEAVAAPLERRQVIGAIPPRDEVIKSAVKTKHHLSHAKSSVPDRHAKAPSPTTSKQNHVHSHHVDHSDHASEESQTSRQLHLDHAKSRQAHLDHAKARQFLLNVADGPSSLRALDAPMGGGASLARPPLSLLLLSSLLIVESVLFESETAIGQGAGQQRLRNLGPLSTCGFFALSVAPACEGCLLR